MKEKPYNIIKKDSVISLLIFLAYIHYINEIMFVFKAKRLLQFPLCQDVVQA